MKDAIWDTTCVRGNFHIPPMNDIDNGMQESYSTRNNYIFPRDSMALESDWWFGNENDWQHHEVLGGSRDYIIAQFLCLTIGYRYQISGRGG